jgi:hypothetical protein
MPTTPSTSADPTTAISTITCTLFSLIDSTRVAASVWLNWQPPRTPKVLSPNDRFSAISIAAASDDALKQHPVMLTSVVLSVTKAKYGGSGTAAVPDSEKNEQLSKSDVAE